VALSFSFSTRMHETMMFEHEVEQSFLVIPIVPNMRKIFVRFFGDKDADRSDWHMHKKVQRGLGRLDDQIPCIRFCISNLTQKISYCIIYLTQIKIDS
jgi:hypothetical protein